MVLGPEAPAAGPALTDRSLTTQRHPRPRHRSLRRRFALTLPDTCTHEAAPRSSCTREHECTSRPAHCSAPPRRQLREATLAAAVAAIAGESAVLLCRANGSVVVLTLEAIRCDLHADLAVAPVPDRKPSPGGRSRCRGAARAGPTDRPAGRLRLPPAGVTGGVRHQQSEGRVVGSRFSGVGVASRPRPSWR